MSSSLNKSTATSTNFTWQVANFAALGQNRVDSPLFGFSCERHQLDAKFFLALHPRGSPSFWSETHSLVYLYIKWSDRDVIALNYTLSILDSTGAKRNPQGN